MKRNHILPIGVLVGLIALLLFSGRTIHRQYCNLERERMFTLTNSYFAMTTVQLKLTDDADWDAGAVVLGTFASAATNRDAGDNQKVKTLIQLVSQVPGHAPYREELMEDLKTLRISWDTFQGHWSSEVIDGDIDSIIESLKNQYS